MNAIHIDRLHFKGRDSQRQWVIADLDRVAWPSLREREYLFIRHLHAVKPAGQLAISLAEQAQALRHAAVSGWRDDADRRQAVYFADYAELLACLSRDLLQKKRRWYWRQWVDLFDLPIETALPSCWRQQQHLIPALIGQLAAHEQLRWFCQQLTDTLAEQLCRVVCPQWDELKQYDMSPADALDQPQPPPRWLAPWQAALAGTDPPVGVMQLAALIALREWQPLKRQAAEMLPVYRAVLRQMLMLASYQSDPSYHTKRAGGTGQTARIEGSSFFANQPANTMDTAIADTDITKSVISADKIKRSHSAIAELQSNQTEQKNPDSAAEAVLDLKAQTVSGFVADRTITVSPPTIRPDAFSDGDWTYPSRLSTQQGGVFYLLNFLNLPRVQDALLSEPLTRDYPSAWGWLWRLAVAMEWQPEPGVENLFAFFCGYDQPEQLRQLPAMPQMQDLLQWGRRRYGEALFNRDIFAVPARIETDACHVDAFYALDHVNLDVRRVGLDIDPGWLPWLGKVVKFHYGVPPLT